MTDFARFGVELIDSVSAPAHRAADALEEIEKRLHHTQSLAALTNQEIAALGAARGFEIVGHAASGFASTMDGVVSSAVHRAAEGAWELTEGVVHMAMAADASKRAMGTLLGGGEGAGEQMFSRTIELAKELGMTVEGSTHAMQKMLAMQFAPDQAEKFVKLTADLKSVGVTAEATERVLLDIAHIKGIDKLNSRELMTFGMAGVNTHMIMEEVAKGMGLKDVKAAYEAMHKGQVTGDIALPAFERAIMRKVHEEAPGEAGAKFAHTSLQGVWTQLQNAPEFLFLKISQSLDKLVPKLDHVVGQIVKFIDGIDTNKLANMVGHIVDVLIQAVPLALKFVDGFMSGLPEITKEFGDLGLSANNLDDARKLGEDFANLLGRIVHYLGEAAKLVKQLSSDWGIGILATIYTGSKAIGALSTIGQLMLLFGGGRGGGGGGLGGAAAGALGSGAGGASMAVGKDAFMRALAASGEGALPGVGVAGASAGVAGAEGAGAAAVSGELAAGILGGAGVAAFGGFALAVGIFAAAAYALANQVQAQDEQVRPSNLLGPVGARASAGLTDFDRAVDKEIAEREAAAASAQEYWDKYKRDNAPTALDTSIEHLLSGRSAGLPEHPADATSRPANRGDRPEPRLAVDRFDMRPTQVDQKFEFNIMVDAGKGLADKEAASQVGQDIAEVVSRQVRKHFADMAIHGAGGDSSGG